MLINSNVVSMATHILSFYLVLKLILKKITSLFLKFWWISSIDKTPTYWKSREMLENHKTRGGLGLKTLEDFNSALLYKQAWRIHTNPQPLVSKLIIGRYHTSPIAKVRAGTAIHQASWSYRGMCRATTIMSEGTRMITCNGRYTSIEQDIWVTKNIIQLATRCRGSTFQSGRPHQPKKKHGA